MGAFKLGICMAVLYLGFSKFLTTKELILCIVILAAGWISHPAGRIVVGDKESKELVRQDKEPLIDAEVDDGK